MHVPLSKPCQQELTTAWLAAQKVGEDAGRRIWIVNPEPTLAHIPELFRDQQIPHLTTDGSQVAALAQGIKDRLDRLEVTSLGNGMRELPAYYDMSPVQFKRFVGRATEMWDLHGNLTANRLSIITGIYGQPLAQVRGLGGNGKSLLAREYSIRFGPAYPGGVFWLNGCGYDGTESPVGSEQRDAMRQDQIGQFARQLHVPLEGLAFNEIENAFWDAVESRGARCLWIVDDVPPGLTWQ